MKTGSRWTLAVATLAGVFGVATVAKGTQVLFGSAVARVDAGHYVPFVLWFNFLAGFAYWPPPSASRSAAAGRPGLPPPSLAPPPWSSWPSARTCCLAGRSRPGPWLR